MQIYQQLSRGRSSPSLMATSLTAAAATVGDSVSGGSSVRGGSPLRGSSPPPGSYSGLGTLSTSGSSSSSTEPATTGGGLGFSSGNGLVLAPADSSSHSSAAAAGLLCEDLGSPSVKLHRQSPSAATTKATILVAPAELPPGDYLCVTEAVLLQVPWGPDIPTHLETTSYQVNVLSKGSIHLGARQASGSGELSDLAKLSSPLKGVLSRISRGLTRSGSDTIPEMSHLQTALDKMREERTITRRSRTGFNSDLHSRSLHTLHEAPAEHDAVSRLKRLSVGSVGGGGGGGGGTPGHATTASAVRSLLGGPAAAAAGGAKPAAGTCAGGDVEMGTASGSLAAGTAAAAAAAAVTGHPGPTAAAAGSGDRALSAAMLPRATGVIGPQQLAGIKHSRSFKFSSLH